MLVTKRVLDIIMQLNSYKPRSGEDLLMSEFYCTFRQKFNHVESCLVGWLVGGCGDSAVFYFYVLIFYIVFLSFLSFLFQSCL